MKILIMELYELIVTLLPLVPILFHMRKKKDVSKYILIFTVLFGFYLYGCFFVTGSGTIYHYFYYGIDWTKINSIPFSQHIDKIGYCLNIIMFLPMGFFIPLIWNLKYPFLTTIGTGFFTTVLIETSQLLNNRSTDIDDIILNIIGAFMGYLLFVMLSPIIPRDKLKKYSGLHPIIFILLLFVSRFLLYHEFGIAKVLYGF